MPPLRGFGARRGARSPVVVFCAYVLSFNYYFTRALRGTMTDERCVAHMSQSAVERLAGSWNINNLEKALPQKQESPQLFFLSFLKDSTHMFARAHKT